MVAPQIFRILITVIMITISLYGGTTGKISGKVTDQTTGEPLIGVNVLITGTSTGAATDINGEYYIINLPPGNYELKFSLIGYSPKIIQDIRVSIDQTTKVDIALGEEAVEIGEVVISAGRPLVRKDLTSTESKVSGDDIAMLPVEDIQSVVNLQAGVVNGHFRGGRANEVKYLIDGVAVNDAFNGNFSLQAEVNSIEELQVLTGTFNAEYGEALSGVVNQVTKIAGDNYEGDVSFYTGDYVSSRKRLFNNIEDISPKAVRSFQGFVSGPVPGIGNLLKFFLSGRYIYDEGYLYGKRVFNPNDSSDFTANNREDWYVGATGDNSYVPMNFNERYTLQGKISINTGSGRGIVLSGMLQNVEYRDYNHSYKLNPDGDYKRFNRSYMGSINYTHVLSNSAFIDFLGSGFITDYSQYVYEDSLDSRYVNPDRVRNAGGGNATFLTGGTENWQFRHKTNTYTVKTDLTWQINNSNQIKTGIEYKLHKLNYEDFQIVMNPPDYLPHKSEKGSSDYNIYESYPYQLAAFIQDKIELDYLVVNLGVRYDYFEPDGEYLINTNNVALLDGLKPPYPDSLVKKASVKQQLSPRIGLSYPITDKGAIHISYGHFFQIPPFENLYRNPNFRIPLSGDYPDNIGNVLGNADLEAQHTIMYEIGLQQEIAPNLGLTLTGYYKDIRNLLTTEIHIRNDFKKFSKLINKDYGAVKGISVSFDRRFANNFGGVINYTFQIAKGNASDPNDNFNKAQAVPPISVNKQLVPLNWDRRHSLDITLTYGIPEDYIISVIGRLGSGLPYTPSFQNARTGLENSENKPTFFNTDLYITKYFKIFNSNVSVFAKVYNLFDTANELDVFGDTGRAGYSLELTRAQEAPRGVNTIEEFYTRPDFYSAPRQVIIGAAFNF